MPEFNFSVLFGLYPALIERMPESFTSHQFIIKLAEENQAHYVEALYSYRQSPQRGRPTPFLIVEGILAQHLLSYPGLVQQTKTAVPSRDIFGSENTCAEWRKVK